MKVGQLMLFQSHHNQPLSDQEVYLKELEIADLTEPCGLDSVWAVEHHFTDYTMCPNIFEFLSYMAGRTTRIGLGTAAVILPWHKDPLRVATDFAMLDNLSRGRALAGIGRGLARIEYDGFGIDMAESRDRMNESAEMILEALETGFMAEHDGKHFKQARRELRPRPTRSFKDRTYVVAMSPDTVPHAARLGGQLMSFALQPWDKKMHEISKWRELYPQHHNRPAPPMVANIFIICDEDAVRAEEMATKYMADYFISAINHYEMDNTHFADKGKGAYDFYQKSAEIMAARGREGMGATFKDLQVYGTPKQCLEMIEAIQDVVGEMDINASFSFAGLDYDYAKQSLKLFGEKCMPALRKWDNRKAAAAE
jgi:alkanesulfonate monooxygenase SsuD/methylene tetrahydromethanopterin reductase-like flavin-dependent oxidoreductase (luciferase family)